MHFTHVDENGNARMVDVGEKAVTSRTATASGRIRMSADCFQLVAAGRMKKGDVLGVAQVAGIMAAKRTSELIPLCHTLLLTKVHGAFDRLRYVQGGRQAHGDHRRAPCGKARRQERRFLF